MNPLSSGKILNPQTLLRLGLGLAFIYAGLHSLVDPGSWMEYAPSWIEFIVEKELFLAVFASFEVLLGVFLIIGRFLYMTSILAFATIFGILVFNGVGDVTFRDFGLMVSAAALTLISKGKVEDS